MIFYLTHSIQQSCGWVKIAEYALDSPEAVALMKAQIRDRHPRDTIAFAERAVEHTHPSSGHPSS